MWRAGPRLSATTLAQKPGGSCNPPLSGSHGDSAAGIVEESRRRLPAILRQRSRNLRRGLFCMTLYSIRDRKMKFAIAAVFIVFMILDAGEPATVWDGVYTEEQATAGQASYAKQ